MDHEIRKLAWQLAAHAEWQTMSGTRAIPVGLPAIEAAASPDGFASEPPAEPSSMVGDPVSAVPTPLAAAATVAPAGPSGAVATVRRTTRCASTSWRARLMFVGEGPGLDEDLKGEPFVGRAGMLLTDIIEKGMRLSRSDVYICNVVKCRPPDNRNPEPDEVEACSPFLRRQIALVQPEVIVALGKFAAQTLLATKTPITRLRGNWSEYEGVPLMPTLHPAYLLRNPNDKKLVWQDIKQVMTRLGMAS
jgi:DNA polymerase